MFWVCLLGTPLFVWGQAASSPYNTNDFLIRFVPGTPRLVIDRLLAEYGAVEQKMSPVSEVRLWYIATFPTPGPIAFSNISEVIGNANSQPEVSGAGENYHVMLTPLTPATPAPWDPEGPCGYKLVNPGGNHPVKVVIMDTGVNYNCPQLKKRFAPDAPGQDFVNHDAVPLDDHGHGTHIAGLIDRVAQAGGTLPIQFVSFKTHDNQGKGELFNIVLAVDEAIRTEVNVINMSFTYQAANNAMGSNTVMTNLNNLTGNNKNGFKIPPFQSAIEEAEEKGILVLAAAGNFSQDNDTAPFPSFPASFPCPNILAVASGNCQKQLSPFSNWGKSRVDIVAPGESLEATGMDCSTAIKTGTSQANALVGGVAAVLGTHFDNDPFDYERVKCAILQGAETVAGLQTKVRSSGVVHAPNALGIFLLNACLPEGHPSSRPVSGTQPSKGSVVLAPNPFAEVLRVQFEVEQPELAQVSIWDAQGKQVFARQWAVEQGQQEMLWEPAGASPGLYTVRVHTSGGVYTSKAVLLH